MPRRLIRSSPIVLAIIEPLDGEAIAERLEICDNGIRN
jgi:hypothetical protein